MYFDIGLLNFARVVVLILSVHFSFLIGALYGIGNALEVKGISKIK